METLKQILLSETPGRTLRAMFADGSLRKLEPSLADLRMHIPAGYHHKDNFEHSVRVLENAIEREQDGPDLVLRAAALFHDIGKPATRKLGARKSVSFDGHESVGARIVRKVLKTHGFSAEQIDQVALIVAMHMRSHGFENKKWTDAGVRRLIADAGSDELLRKLIIVFYADVTTRHEDKMRKLHRSVDALVEEIAAVKASDARKALRPALDGHRVMELYGLTPGRVLGSVMRFLNSDEGVHLSAEEAEVKIRELFGEQIVAAGGHV